MPIPPDNRAAGDAGHITDHNNIADELTTLTAAVAAMSGGSVDGGSAVTGARSLYSIDGGDA